MSIQIKNLTFAYAQKVIFNNLTLTLETGVWTALLGPSGVGKTSLLRILAGLAKPSAGKIEYQGSNLESDHISYMAQTDLLLPWLTVLDNTQLSYILKGAVTANVKTRALALLKAVGLAEVTNNYPHALSGGMRQRVALARTLLANKPIILMDEPFSALDTITRYRLQALAVEMLAGKTVIFITHDPMEALRVAKFIYVLNPKEMHPVIEMHSTAPRDYADLEVIKLQNTLLNELLKAAS